MDRSHEIARLTAERDEARALAVFSVKSAAEYSYLGEPPRGRVVYWRTNVDMVVEDCDGTDAGILDALRRAKGASNGQS